MKKQKQQEQRLEQQKKQLQKDKRELRKDAKLPVSLNLPSSFLKKEEKRITAEETIPYLKMFRTGICQIDEGHFNKCISFEDINYQLALEEHRDLIFNQYANFLNSFDPSVELQLSYVNQLGRNSELENAIKIPNKGDDYDEVRKEFRKMLKDQLNKGNN